MNMDTVTLAVSIYGLPQVNAFATGMNESHARAVLCGGLFQAMDGG